MADYGWSYSTCRPADGSGGEPVQWYGIPGSGSHLYTVRYGQYWVGGGVYQTYAAWGYECGALGAPVKVYQWLSEFGAYGQWFEGGAIFYRSGRWQVALGNYGQTAGRLTEAPEAEAPADAELPPDPPTKPPKPPKRKAPKDDRL